MSQTSYWAFSKYSPSDLKIISQNIAQRLEQQGGFAVMKKDELMKLAKQQNVKVSSSWTKTKIIDALKRT